MRKQRSVQRKDPTYPMPHPGQQRKGGLLPPNQIPFSPQVSHVILLIVHGDRREKRGRRFGVGVGGKVDEEVWMAPHCREWERLLVLRSLVLSEGWLGVMGG